MFEFSDGSTALVDYESDYDKRDKEKEKQQFIQDIVKRMIEQGYPTEKIVSLVPNYLQEDVKMLWNEIAGK